jgi:alpha-mannosidase
MITTIKKAEEGTDIIIRMYDASGAAGSVELDTYFRLNNLSKTNIIEEDAAPVGAMNVPAFSIETFKLSLSQ